MNIDFNLFNLLYFTDLQLSCRLADVLFRIVSVQLLSTIVKLFIGGTFQIN